MKGHVLLIDDNQIDLKVLSGQLNSIGYLVTPINDARDVVEALANNQFDLIMMDLKMPFIGGFELLRSSAFTRLSSGVPVLVMSSSMNTRDDVVQAIKLGAEDFIVKPVDHLILEAKLLALRADFSGSYGLDIKKSSKTNIAKVQVGCKVLRISETYFDIETKERYLPESKIKIDWPASEGAFGDCVLKVVDSIESEDGHVTRVKFLGLNPEKCQQIRSIMMKLYGNGDFIKKMRGIDEEAENEIN